MSELNNVNMGNGFRKLDDELLEDVIGGGEWRLVDTKSKKQPNAAIRPKPGLNNDPIDSITSGKKAYATGKFVNNVDGRSWAEISEPCHGWIAASILGYDRYHN